jgi:hypothetical protein
VLNAIVKNRWVSLPLAAVHKVASVLGTHYPSFRNDSDRHNEKHRDSYAGGAPTTAIK